MYKNILVPVDVSHADAAIEVLRKAHGLLDEGGNITTLYAMNTMPGYISAYVSKDEIDKSKEEIKAKLAEVSSAAGTHVKTMLRDGSAGPVIVEVAKEIGADLVIVASHSPGLQDYLIGSTAGRVVRHAGCSVLVHR